MKKIELITINEPHYPQKSSIEKKKYNFYHERNNIISNAFNIDEKLTINEKKKIFDKNIIKIYDDVDFLFHQFAFLKLFYMTAKRCGSFNIKLKEFENYFEMMKSYVENIENNYNNIKKNDELFNHSYQELIYSISDIFNFISSLKSDLRIFEDEYYPKMKVTAYNLCEGKTYKDIEKLSENVNKYIQQFKGIDEAFVYICYNSGSLITDTIDALVDSAKGKGININPNYFFKSDVIIALSYYEWVDFIGKIKRLLNKNITLNDRFKKLYEELTIRYTVIIIYNALMEN